LTFDPKQEEQTEGQKVHIVVGHYKRREDIGEERRRGYRREEEMRR